MKKYRFITFILLSLTLTSCSRSIVSDVTRFHNLTPPDNTTIEVTSLRPELQKTLEFGQYAELVGNYLGRQGYLPPQGQPSMLIAQIGYDARPVEGPQYGGSGSSVGIGVGGGGHRSNVGVGISIPIGQTEPKLEYIRSFILKIIRRSDGVILYDGKVTSRGKEPLPLALPYLVDALFQDFPGKNGSSNRVKVTP